MFLTHLVIGALIIIICIWALLRPIQKISLTDPMARTLVYLGILVTLIILYVSLAYSFNFGNHQISSHPSDWGVFGDFLGGVLNPILSFFTIVILLMSGYVQNKQYKELLDKQQLESKKNDFDKMFTLMLEQHNSYLDKPEFINHANIVYNDLLKLINIKNYSLEQLNKIFNEYPIINTYLRLLYRVLKYLTEENQTTSNYSRLLRSFCSEEILFIIAANSLRINHHNRDYADYKLLLEKTNFLEHINLSDLYRKWNDHIQQKGFLLKTMNIQNDNSNFCVKNNFDQKETITDGPFDEEKLTKYINEKIISTDNLFLDIMKINPSAFNNDTDYNYFTNQIVALNNLLRTTWEKKLKILKASSKK